MKLQQHELFSLHLKKIHVQQFYETSEFAKNPFYVKKVYVICCAAISRNFYYFIGK